MLSFVRPFVHPEFFLKTGHRIFLKLGRKLNELNSQLSKVNTRNVLGVNLCRVARPNMLAMEVHLMVGEQESRIGR